MPDRTPSRFQPEDAAQEIPSRVTHDMIRQAVADGIREAVSDPTLWEAAGDAMRRQAQSAAGGWLLGGVRAMVTRAAWVIAALAAIYALGGWGAVAAFLKSGNH